MHPSVCPCIHPSVHESIHSSIHLPTHPPWCHPSIHSASHPPIHPLIDPPILVPPRQQTQAYNVKPSINHTITLLANLVINPPVNPSIQERARFEQFKARIHVAAHVQRQDLTRPSGELSFRVQREANLSESPRGLSIPNTNRHGNTRATRDSYRTTLAAPGDKGLPFETNDRTSRESCHFETCLRPTYWELTLGRPDQQTGNAGRAVKSEFESSRHQTGSFLSLD